MSKLLLHGPQGNVMKEFALDHERITIGRKAHNDIHLEGSAVSGNHAVIITLGSDSFLEDLHSTNGTSVNHASVHKCVLQDGDEIKIAHYHFTFVSEGTAQSAPGKTISATPRNQAITQPHHAGTTMDAITLIPEAAGPETAVAPPVTLQPVSLLGDEELAPSCDLLSGAPASQGSGTQGIIRIVSGPGAGQSLELSKPAITLGKPGIQVAAITQRDGQYYLGMVEGDELPKVNESEIKDLPHRMQHGDIITIAGVELEFLLK